jgi:hypothetical protein
MMSAALVTAALVSLLPSLNPSRIDELAQTISAVADTQDDAARLAVTVARESSGLRSYETCELSGDHGRAWTAWQLHVQHWGRHTKAEICSDPELATELALVALRRRKSPRGSFAAYLGRVASDSEVVLRVRLYFKALAAMGVSS